MNLIYGIYRGTILYGGSDYEDKINKLMEACEVPWIRGAVMIEAVDFNDDGILAQFKEMIAEISADTSDHFGEWVLYECIDLQILKRRDELALRMVFEILVFILKDTESLAKGKKIFKTLKDGYFEKMAVYSNRRKKKKRIEIFNTLIDLTSHPVLDHHKRIKYDLLELAVNFVDINQCYNRLMNKIEENLAFAPSTYWKNKYWELYDKVKLERGKQGIIRTFFSW